MKYNEKTLAKAVKGGELPPVVLLYGGEPFLVERWAKALAGEGDSFNLQRLDGKKPDLEALWDALQALPLFAAEKTVLLDGVEGGSLNADELKTFAALLEDIPEGVTLVITAKDPAFGNSAGGKKLVKLAEKHGGAAELSTPAPGDLSKFLVGLAKERGCVLSPELAKYLLQICPGEMLVLQSEVDKICAYAGAGEITRAQIDAVAVAKIEARAFDLQKHILAGDAGKALTLLAGLFQLREDPVAILAALSMGFCDLYRARCVRDAGGGKEDMVREFAYSSEFRARRAFEQCGRYATKDLRRAVGKLCDCDRLMKSTGVDTALRLEQLVVELIGLCGRAA